jgi:hypothetical protein
LPPEETIRESAKTNKFKDKSREIVRITTANVLLDDGIVNSSSYRIDDTNDEFSPDVKLNLTKSTFGNNQTGLNGLYLERFPGNYNN